MSKPAADNIQPEEVPADSRPRANQGTPGVPEGLKSSERRTSAKSREADTSGYSATQAPENREHVQSETQLSPNAPRRPDIQVGMEALQRDTIPSMASDTEHMDSDDNSMAKENEFRDR
jgi:hypothetical protein